MLFFVTFGLPGAGKSTYLSKHFNPHDIVSADKIMMSYPSFNPSNPQKELFDLAVDEAEQCVYDCVARKDETVVFDTTSINNNYSRRILSKVKEAGYTIIILVFTTSLVTCLERNKSREFNVPEETIMKKYESAPKALWNLLPIVDKVEVVNG